MTKEKIHFNKIYIKWIKQVSASELKTIVIKNVFLQVLLNIGEIAVSVMIILYKNK